MREIGIDSISFYTSNQFLDLAVLAKAHNIDVNKYYLGLGQQQMSVPAPDEDIVTMAANAAKQALENTDASDIRSLLFATESGIDQSKAAGIHVHHLLGLPPTCRTLELKQACYSGTGALMLAVAMVQRNPSNKILVIASDIARYGLGTTGESSQGCGAIAIVVSANPRVMTIEPESGFYTDDIMDFWRPNYLSEALVEGKYSSKMYLSMLDKCWQQYSKLSKRKITDHYRFCYHTPVPRLVEKANKFLAKINGQDNLPEELFISQTHDALMYNRCIGNSYTASLYVSLCSLLDNSLDDLSEKRVGMYSYGSGCVAEFFSGIIQPEYKKYCHQEAHKNLIVSRKPLTHAEYEELYKFALPQDGSEFTTANYQQPGQFRLAGINKHKRLYELTPETVISKSNNQACHENNTETQIPNIAHILNTAHSKAPMQKTINATKNINAHNSNNSALEKDSIDESA